MKKIVGSLVGILLVTGGLGYLFRDSLWDSAKKAITKDMFIAGDTDAFDPGVAAGEPFPAIRAVYQGREITSTERFAGDKGMLFIANRSASW